VAADSVALLELLDNTRHLNRAPSAKAVHGRMPRSFSPAAMALRLVAPLACSSSMVGLRSAALLAALSWRTAADRLRIFAVGRTPRLPPSWTPRRFTAANASFVRLLIMRRSFGIRHVGRDEVDTSLIEAEQEVRIARQPVELGDDQPATVQPAGRQRRFRLRPIVLLAALDLDKLLDQLPPPGVQVVLNRLPLTTNKGEQLSV
jgi:hypothetical protein